MTKATLKKWAAAASMGWGRGFKTQELENLPKIKKSSKKVGITGMVFGKKRMRWFG
jgi:hypothetical protein